MMGRRGWAVVVVVVVVGGGGGGMSRGLVFVDAFLGTVVVVGGASTRVVSRDCNGTSRDSSSASSCGSSLSMIGAVPIKARTVWSTPTPATCFACSKALV